MLSSTSCCLLSLLQEHLQVGILGSQDSVAVPAPLTLPLVGPCPKHLETRYCPNLIHVLVSGATQWSYVLLMEERRQS